MYAGRKKPLWTAGRKHTLVENIKNIMKVATAVKNRDHWARELLLDGARRGATDLLLSEWKC